MDVIQTTVTTLNARFSKPSESLTQIMCSQSLTTPLSLLFNCLNFTSSFQGSCYDVMNYRPTALLPFLSKVFENLVHRRFFSYLEYNNLRNQGPPNYGPWSKSGSALNIIVSCPESYKF